MTIDYPYHAANHPKEPQTNPSPAVTAQILPLSVCSTEHMPIGYGVQPHQATPRLLAGLSARPAVPCAADLSCGREAGPIRCYEGA